MRIMAEQRPLRTPARRQPRGRWGGSLALQPGQVSKPAGPDAGFKRRAEHQIRDSTLELMQQRSRIPLQHRTAHLPPRPDTTPVRLVAQALVKGHRHLPQELLMSGPIAGCQGLLQPLQPGVAAQDVDPAQGGGQRPAAVGIEPQPGLGGQHGEQPLQQLQLLRRVPNPHLPLQRDGRAVSKAAQQ